MLMRTGQGVNRGIDESGDNMSTPVLTAYQKLALVKDNKGNTLLDMRHAMRRLLYAACFRQKDAPEATAVAAAASSAEAVEPERPADGAAQSSAAGSAEAAAAAAVAS